mmetsp:Transcript_67354/g.133474  ORF Transcript_67354/g.133474 Transcript_67354/m.133474 type:complete len:214 (+) Transcript_67354:187-828(+)
MDKEHSSLSLRCCFALSTLRLLPLPLLCLLLLSCRALRCHPGLPLRLALAGTFLLLGHLLLHASLQLGVLCAHLAEQPVEAVVEFRSVLDGTSVGKAATGDVARSPRAGLELMHAQHLGNLRCARRVWLVLLVGKYEQRFATQRIVRSSLGEEPASLVETRRVGGIDDEHRRVGCGVIIAPYPADIGTATDVHELERRAAPRRHSIHVANGGI